MYSYVDMHCDTLLRTMRETPDSLYDGEGMQSISLMHEAKQMCQFFAVFFPPRGGKFKDGTERPPMPPDDEFFAILSENLRKEVAIHKDVIAMASNYAEIKANWEKGLSSAVLTVEDGRMVEGKMEKLHYLYEQGVRAIALTWNFANCFGYPNSKDAEIMSKGLTDFGIEAIGEMNRLGILVDVSHLSDGGFYDVAKYSKKPFIASHSNCRALTDHTRNLTDEMIRILADKGGVSGLNFGPDFVKPQGMEPDSRAEYLADHVLHFIKTGGEDCVGLGTDFDGVGGHLEISRPTQMELLFDTLHKKGLTERQLEKFASGNVLRVMKESIG